MHPGRREAHPKKKFAATRTCFGGQFVCVAGMLQRVHLGVGAGFPSPVAYAAPQAQFGNRFFSCNTSICSTQCDRAARVQAGSSTSGH